MNKKGSALMQVLLVSVIIAVIAVFMLRLSLSRTTTVTKARTFINAKHAVDACQAEVNFLMTDMRENSANPGKTNAMVFEEEWCTSAVKSYPCHALNADVDSTVVVYADIVRSSGNNYCQITYRIDSGALDIIYD
ncbi:hypothetical protein [Parelusimicrobium proximum]|uniref:hypothetical protein n=1 Tax=Parelusimicrobium proximum TaxID=3228953 RepID=UPI003D16B4C6